MKNKTYWCSRCEVDLKEDEQRKHILSCGAHQVVIVVEEDKCELCDGLVDNANLAYCDSCQKDKENE